MTVSLYVRVVVKIYTQTNPQGLPQNVERMSAGKREDSSAGQQNLRCDSSRLRRYWLVSASTPSLQTECDDLCRDSRCWASRLAFSTRAWWWAIARSTSCAKRPANITCYKR
jgi:hypothetical protein